MDKDYIGEVIESSTGDFLAECLELNSSPPFGSFVKVAGRSPTIGLVFSVSTHSIEPNRRPTAYGKTEEELRLEQPQIFELLKTEFRALITGYIDTTGAHPFLPPQPPRIHNPADVDRQVAGRSVDFGAPVGASKVVGKTHLVQLLHDGGFLAKRSVGQRPKQKQRRYRVDDWPVNQTAHIGALLVCGGSKILQTNPLRASRFHLPQPADNEAPDAQM